ncbi:membrane protein [Kitasatospora herbaricolor]|uniref:Hemolysin family protein n=1 Tax=Kitasatospora herbaricolor TaxID=68217 RepID=A0ABZ1WC56_9ACTN|nr:hemolysin family protein [Kitasatospora herbaricolor]MDQ0308784.1 putative hemolysin [Kitasatospora herbaricolor]GGV10214.1 membrane protein [Kitasatospora herbaricolor]
MNETLGDAALVLVFIMLGGLFNVAEISLISLREGQIRALESKGTRRAARAAHLAADPNRFLAAVQVGVTCMGFLSAAFGADTLAGKVAPLFVDLGLSPGLSDAVALVGLTLVISYVSLVLGELTPKRIGLQRADSIAVLAAPVVDVMSVVLRPAIWLLGHSTNLMVRLFGGDPKAGRGSMSSEELRGLVAANTELGSDERALIADVFAAGERQLREVMVPRTEVTFLDAERLLAEVREETSSSPHSRYPVVEGSYDAVVGFVHVRDLYGARGEQAVRVRDLARPVKLLPATKRVLEAMGEMRREGHHLAIVVDEYGGTAGIVSLEDLVEEVIGEIRDEYDSQEPTTTRRLAGGGMELDGLLNLGDFTEETGVTVPEGPYETVAGYVVAELGRLPVDGDSVRMADGVLLTVAKVEGRRIARLRVSAVTLAQPSVEEVS